MKPAIFILSAAVLLASCIGNKKIATAKNKVKVFAEQILKEKKEITALNNQADTKLQLNKIDSNILRRIGTRLARETAKLDSGQVQTDELNEILKDKKSSRKNYKKIILPLLDSLQKQHNQYAQRLDIYLMIQDGLNVADFKLFDLAAFFGPGKYQIPEDKIDIAALSFIPLLDSVMNFSNKYSQYPRTATLIILGFADGIGVTEGSELYYTLLDELRKPNAEKEVLNQKLSELRAKELIKQMTVLYLKNAPDFKEADKLKIEYIGQGKGEAMPMKSINDYADDDARRRIVLCYWVVLPN